MTVSVRYIVDNVDQAIPFYVDLLGFHLDMHPVPAFAMLSLGEMRLLLNQPGPGSGAGRSMPDGSAPAPGGWNRFQFEVSDIDATYARLKAAGARFRNEVINGNGGRQVIVDDPSGNPIEIFQQS